MSTTNTLTVTITNNTTASIDVTSVAILNDTNAVYSLVGAPTVTTPIAASANIQFDVQYDPGATAQTSTAQLEVQNTGPNTTITVNITGTSATVPTADITPTPGTPHDMGDQPVGGSALTASFTITNNGTADLIITDLSITGTDYALTAGAVTTPTTVTPTNTHAFTVEFDDTSSTVQTAVAGQVSITHNAAGSPVTINFVADVVSVPVIFASYQTAPTGTGPATDDSSVDVTLPFTFPWLATAGVTDIRISSNGWVEFGSPFTGTTGRQVDLFDGTGNGTPPGGSKDFVAMYSADLNPGSGGTITHGSATVNSQQAYIVDYSGVPYFTATGATSFQVIFFENGDIQINYSSLVGTTTQTRSIGLGTALNTNTTTTVGDFNTLNGIAGGGTDFNAGTGHTIDDDLGSVYTAAPPTSLDGKTIYFQRRTSGATYTGWTVYTDNTP